MAMRPRGRMGSQSFRPPFRPPFRQSPYETFRPRSEWKFENDATLLLLHLPGFVKEQIRTLFTYNEDASLGIKIQGQRPLPNARWSQFTEVFRVPEDCDASRISSQFERGVLTVVMPKLIVTKPEDQQIAEPGKTQESKTTPSRQASAPERTPSPKTTKDRITTPSPQASTRERTPSLTTTKDRITTPSPERSSSESSSESESPESESPREGEKKLAEAVTAHKPTSDEKTRRGVDKSTSSEAAVEEKLGEEKPLVEQKSQKGGNDSISSEGTAFVDEKKRADHDPSEKPMPEKNNVEDIKGMVQGRESATRSEEKENGEDDYDDDKRSGKKIEKREEQVNNDNGGVAETEERKTLVNMGTALLVLLGLAAFISYKITSSGKP